MLKILLFLWFRKSTQYFITYFFTTSIITIYIVIHSFYEMENFTLRM
jgi:hypothetical protein